MDFDLTRPLPKATTESERPVEPAESFARACEAARRVGIELDFDVELHGDVFWTARLLTDVRELLSDRARSVRMAGKGASREQALASCAMELVERLSLYRFAERLEQRRAAEVTCYELRTGVTRWMSPPRDLWDTQCVAAGIRLEDATLHCLHELIETRIVHSCFWRPFKVVDVAALLPELPAWVSESMLVVKSPSDVAEFHHVTALTLPPDGHFDDRVSDTVIRTADHLFWSAGGRRRNAHSPASGGAAGLDVRKCAFRAMNEVFQGRVEPPHSIRRRPLPEGIELTSDVDHRSYETSSITDDIRLILERLGSDAFVGIVDLTDPDMSIPVVRLVSDWDPKRSLASRDVLATFFEI